MRFIELASGIKLKIQKCRNAWYSWIFEDLKSRWCRGGWRGLDGLIYRQIYRIVGCGSFNGPHYRNTLRLIKTFSPNIRIQKLRNMPSTMVENGEWGVSDRYISSIQPLWPHISVITQNKYFIRLARLFFWYHVVYLLLKWK